MTWLGWRLQRTETLAAGALLAALALFLVPQGLDMASSFAAGHLSACAFNHTRACGFAVRTYLGRFDFARSVLGWLRLVPGVIGVLLAAPLVLELENGSYRLAWTQSVTRSQLLRAKLAVSIGTALAAAGAFALLATWCRGPLDDLTGRMDSSVFDIEWIVPLGCALFALGVAFAIGVASRRTGVSVVVAFAAYVAARIVVDAKIRPHYVTPVTASSPIGSARPGGASLDGALVLSQHLVDRAGRPFSVTPKIVAECSRFAGPGPHDVGACLARHGAAALHSVYQPASRFWLFQTIETALFAGIGLALIALAAWWLQRRAV